MSFTDYERELKSSLFDPSRVLDRFFHSGQSYVFNQAAPEEQPEFKRTIIRDLRDLLRIEIHPLQLILCGSAHLGFSPVPLSNKFGKSFNPKKSDIDIAVVSPELFDQWWTELQKCKLVAGVIEDVARNLFWGFIDPSNVNQISKTAERWWKYFGDFKTDRANGVRGRVYRSFSSMENYHLEAIKGGRRLLLGERKLD
jgi:hypothetical protein